MVTKRTLIVSGVVVVLIAASMAVYIVFTPRSSPKVSSIVDKADASSNAFFDIIGARVSSLADEDLSFEVTVAGVIPSRPNGTIIYGWFLTSGVAKLNSPLVSLAYDPSTASWEASLLAGRPPATVLTGLNYAISDTTATVKVPLDTLGKPSDLTWHVVSRSASFGVATPLIDRAPDNSDAQWPAKT